MANAYTLVQALKAAGKNLTRQDLVNAIDKEGGKWTGPGLVPYRYGGTQHGGFGGAEMGKIQNGKIVLFGGPLTTSPAAGSADHPVHDGAAGAAVERGAEQLATSSPLRGPAVGMDAGWRALAWSVGSAVLGRELRLGWAGLPRLAAGFRRLR